MTRLILVAVAGAAVGGIVGYIGKCSGGACPLTCHPLGGMVVGALVAVLVVKGFAPGPAGFTPSPHVVAVTTPEAFDRLLHTNAVVLVDFYADWCGPCRALKPTLHALADEYQGRVLVAAVNVDASRELAARYGVNSIPDVRLFRHGAPPQQFVGARPKSEFAAALDQALKTD